jgi:hypothetical protein
MRKIIKGLLPDDPMRPSLKALGKWKYYRQCQDCSHADMERPNQAQAHPATGMRSRSDMRPGSHLTIDGSGAFKVPARSGITQTFMFTNNLTSYRSSRATRDKSCMTLLNEVKMWVSHVGHMPETLWLRSIHTDNEFMCEPLITWCRENGIKLTSCAPHTHQQNAVSETTVKMIKRVVRRNEVMARTGAKLRALCYSYVAHQLNRTPNSTDPSGQMRTPVSRWPHAPFYHASQELHPWGCLVHGFLRKRSTDPNSTPRA